MIEKETQKPVFGLHTAEFKRCITEKEANAMKGFFGLKPEEELTRKMDFYEQGITKLWIEEIPGNGKPRRFIHAIVNFARATGSVGYAVMPYTTANVKRAYKRLDRVLKTLPLSDRNNQFSEWTTERIDSAFDIYEEQAELLMRLLNRSVDLSDARKKCKRIPIPNKTPEEAMSQSLRFGNASFVYNIYRKMEEIRDKGKAITEEERDKVQNLLRIERQNHKDAVKKLLPDMKAGDLAKASVREGILKTMLDEIGLFFGKGDFYSWGQIQVVHCLNQKADVRATNGIMVKIAMSSLEAVQDLYSKEIRDAFDRLEFSPAGIRVDEVEQYGRNYMDGIYNRIAAEYTRPLDKRQYHAFPVPHKIGDGRYKAAITLYSAAKGTRRVQVAGKTLEDYEYKVRGLLGVTYLHNQKYRDSDDAEKRNMLLKSVDSLRRFGKVAKTPEIKKEMEKWVKNFETSCKNGGGGL